MAKYDVITVGSGLVDASIPTNIKEKKKFINLPIGIKIPINKIIFSKGGGGTNTASCISKLGLKSAYLGKVGSGYNGQIILRELKKDRVDFIGVKTKEHTGYSIILKTTNNRRTILSYKGASNKLKFSEVNKNKLSTRWFHFTSMDGDSFETQNKIADLARKKEIKISFNPGIAKIKQGLPKLRKIIRNTHFLSMNKEEARKLLNTQSSEKTLLKKLGKLGPEIVSITDGINEGMVYDGTTIYKYTPKKVHVKECTGAGDAFSSSFISGLIKFKDVEKSLKLAIVNSSAVVRKDGATGGLLNMKQALSEIKKYKFNIEKE